MKNSFLCLALTLFASTDVFSRQLSKLELNLSADTYFVARDQFSYFILAQTFEVQYNQDATPRTHPSLGLRYFITDRLSLKSGLRYYDFGHKSDRFQINLTPPAIQSSHRYKAHFLSIPIGADFRFINRKFFSYVGASMLMDIYFGETSDEPEFESIDGLDWRTINASAFANLGLGYQFSETFSFSIEPYATIPLHDYMIEEDFFSVRDIKPFRLGLQAGLNYRFQ
ncbi:MAG: hypothetical protein ED557_10600 [Balneola sp.]|nr:MAG: hypothetical protein ED557_10600 [Balneola sp.]